MNQDNELRLRVADWTDADRILAWRNDPWIVAQGSLNRTVSFEEHHSWFARRIEDTRHPIWIVEIGGEPVGMARLDSTPDRCKAEVSLYLMKSHCGRGKGPQVLARVAQTAKDLGHEILQAVVRRDNVASLKAFQKAGYRTVSRGETDFTLHLPLETERAMASLA